MKSPTIAEQKRKAVYAAIDWLKERYDFSRNLKIGMGSGSTVSYGFEMIAELGNFQVVPTSLSTESALRGLGIETIDRGNVGRLMFDLDGADEVGPNLNLIKGGGGHHLKEKQVALISDQLVVVVDHTKVVDYLGQKRPVPLEVKEELLDDLIRSLKKWGGPEPRIEGDELFRTDNGNPIIDLKLKEAMVGQDMTLLEDELNDIEGVLENGIFSHRPADIAFVGREDSVQIMRGS